ncbi:MAG: hypothetical protein IPQ08_12325 [Chitinophagaceae bacterium]|nr:hypothetical protein [Chitinophagaceae bacterium]
MRINTKNIISFLLLVILASPFIYTQVMEYQRNRTRVEMKERMKQELLSQVTLPANQIHWYSEGKEILIGEDLFDVVSQVILPDGQIRFTGLFDSRETTLNDQLNKLQQDRDQKKSRQLAQYFNDWQATPPSTEEPLLLIILTKEYFVSPEMETAAAYSSILKPPPQA